MTPTAAIYATTTVSSMAEFAQLRQLVLAQRAIAELQLERERWHRGLNMAAYVDQRIEWIRVQAQRGNGRQGRQG